MASFDFDPTESDLRIGLEVEYPIAPSRSEQFTARGQKSMDLKSEVRNDGGMPSYIGGRAAHDGTVGLEVVSDVLDLGDAHKWYADVIDYLENEYHELHAPVGIVRGNTAGLHMHLSELSRDEARELYDISMTPWMQVFVCSTIVSDGRGQNWRVFRGGSYSRENFNQGRYSTVNGRGQGHWEWRMPEPMTPNHLEMVMRFLALFEKDPTEARTYVQEVLDEGDSTITAIRRAEAVGMDLDETPTVIRAPYENDPENFYMTIEDSWGYPEIHQVNYDGATYYVFESRLDGTFEVEGITFHADDVLYADSLEPAADPVASDVWRVFQRNRHGETNRSHATDELEKIVKKKKE